MLLCPQDSQRQSADSSSNGCAPPCEKVAAAVLGEGSNALLKACELVADRTGPHADRSAGEVEGTGTAAACSS